MQLPKFIQTRIFRNTLVLVGFVVVVAAVYGLLTAVVKPPAPSHDNASGSPAGQAAHFKTSKLIEPVVSLRNLKGLMIRINQIDTCSPTAVSAYVAVSTDAGVVNKDFTKSDIKLYLDGKQISSFNFNSVSNQQPISNVLAIDHSGSMNGTAMDDAKTAAEAYVDDLQTGDQVSIVQFDDKVDTLVTQTTDKAIAKSAIAGIQARGNTSIYDALNQSITLVPNCGRKAVTVLTDGEDTSSTSNAQAVIDAANKANLPIFAVGLRSPDFTPGYLQQIADSTGAQFLEANDPTQIGSLYQNINGQLKGQFEANLKVPFKKTGQVHTLKIVSNVDGSPTSSERSFVY